MLLKSRGNFTFPERPPGLAATKKRTMREICNLKFLKCNYKTPFFFSRAYARAQAAAIGVNVTRKFLTEEKSGQNRNCNLRNFQFLIQRFPLYTHVCILCWRRVKLGWDKNREGWVTTEGQTHVNEYHKSEKQKEKLEKEKLEKTEKKQSFLMVGMAAAGDARSGASSAFGLSPGQYAKTKAAQYYIYGQARVSKMTFDDDEFRELLRSYCVAGGGNRENCPILRRSELVEYVRTEFNCFCLLMAGV